MTANGNEALTLSQLKMFTESSNSGGIGYAGPGIVGLATGDEVVTLKQLKMLRDNLTDDILGQFSDELDTIIGADTTPIPDAIAWADKINGEDVNGDSAGLSYIAYGSSYDNLIYDESGNRTIYPNVVVAEVYAEDNNEKKLVGVFPYSSDSSTASIHNYELPLYMFDVITAPFNDVYITEHGSGKSISFSPDGTSSGDLQTPVLSVMYGIVY